MVVRNLLFTHPSLSSPVVIPLGLPVNGVDPWNDLTPQLQHTLDSLDVNHDGTITCALDDQIGETSFAGFTSVTLSRALWGFAGPNPSNNRIWDYDPVHTQRRDHITAELGMHVYDRVVIPLLEDTTNPNRWRDAANALKLVAYPQGLYRFGRRLEEEAGRSASMRERRRLLDLAEDCYLTYLHLASRMPRHYQAISGVYPGIDDFLLQAFRPLERRLDAWDDEEFAVDRSRPYLMATMGSPVTANFGELEDKEIVMEVAVPNSFLQNHSTVSARESAVRDYFNSIGRVRVESESDVWIPLEAVSALIDMPGSQDDVVDGVSSFHTQQENLNRNLFPGTPMTYFHVSFHPMASSMIRPSLGRRWKLDLVMDRDPSLVRGQVRSARVLPGSFVLQSGVGPTRSIVASDTHVAFRELTAMAETMTRLEAAHQPRAIRESMDRLYDSPNDRVLAAIQVWNDLYNRGRIDRVEITGDLVDYVHQEGGMASVPFRRTNVHTFAWLFSQLRAPLYVISGNHDPHLDQYPWSVECRNFIRSPGYCEYFGDYYDNYHSVRPLLWAGVRSLMTGTVGNEALSDLSAANRMVTQAYRTSPFGNEHEDDGMNHFLRYVGVHENYGVRVTRGTRFYFIKSGPEDISFLNFVYNRVPEPVASNINAALNQALTGRQVPGRGPIHQEFLSFIYEVEAARAREERMVVFLHYPVLAPGFGPDRTPYNADALTDLVSRAFRLITWYFRFDDQSPVVPLVIAGHIHAYTEIDFQLLLSSSEKFALRRDINLILHGIDPTLPQNEIDARLASIQRQQESLPESQRSSFFPVIPIEFADHIYEHLDTLWNRMHLNRRLQVRSVDYPDADGVPTTLVRSLHHQPVDGRVPGSLFLTQTAMGPASLYGNAFLTVTTEQGHPIEVDATYLRVAPDGAIVTDSGDHLYTFLSAEGESLREWDPSFDVKPSPVPNRAPQPSVWDGRYVGREYRPSFFPSICQYPLSVFCADAYARPEYDFIRDRFGLNLGLRLAFPFNRRAHPGFTLRPNYWFAEVGVDPVNATFNTVAGANHGIFDWFFGVRTHFETGATLLEAGLSTNHQMPIFFRVIPDVSLSGGFNPNDHSASVFLGLRWSYTLGQVREVSSKALP